MHVGFGADTCSTGQRGDIAVDGDDVCHGEKGGEAGADFSEEIAAFPLFRLRLWFSLTFGTDRAIARIQCSMTYMAATVQPKPFPHGTAGNPQVGVVDPST